MLAKHIQVAREEGPKAGFRSYMASSAPTARERQAQIRAAGNAKAQFSAYCAIFGDKFGNGLNTAAVEQHNDERKLSVRERLAAMLLRGDSTDALVEALVNDDLDDEPVGVVVEAEPVLSEADQLRKRADELDAAEKARKAEASKPKPSTKPEGEKYAPSADNAGKLATSGRLWRLNEAGMLSIRSKPGQHITNGTAHKVLSALLDD